MGRGAGEQAAGSAFSLELIRRAGHGKPWLGLLRLGSQGPEIDALRGERVPFGKWRRGFGQGHENPLGPFL